MNSPDPQAEPYPDAAAAFSVAAQVPAAATEAQEVAPMRILDAHKDRFDRLRVLVDRVPTWSELRFRPYPILERPPWRPSTLYMAVHPGGYVRFLLDTGDGLGYGGDSFDLALVDGTRRTVVGPWSSRSEVVAAVAPAADVYLGDVLFYNNREDFHRPEVSGRPASLTRTAAQRALHLAAHRAGSTQPTALATAFTAHTPAPTAPNRDPTGRVALSKPGPQSTPAPRQRRR